MHELSRFCTRQNPHPAHSSYSQSVDGLLSRGHADDDAATRRDGRLGSVVPTHGLGAGGLDHERVLVSLAAAGATEGLGADVALRDVDGAGQGLAGDHGGLLGVDGLGVGVPKLALLGGKAGLGVAGVGRLAGAGADVGLLQGLGAVQAAAADGRLDLGAGGGVELRALVSVRLVGVVGPLLELLTLRLGVLDTVETHLL